MKGIPSIQGIPLTQTFLYQRFMKTIRENEMCSVLVYGRKGIGKTTISMILSHSLYNDWDKVLDHLIFTPQQFSKLLEKYDGEERIKCIIFDDAGTWLNKYKYRTSEMVTFCKLYDLMRSLVAVVIFTSPNPNNILKYVREDTDIFIKVREYRGSIRECDVYERFYTHPIPKVGGIQKGTLVMEKILIDLHDLPKEVYEKYLTKRRRAVRKAVQDFFNLYSDEVYEKMYYTIGEASHILGYSYYHLYRLVKKGKVKCENAEGKKLIPRSELLRLLELKKGRKNILWKKEEEEL